MPAPPSVAALRTPEKGPAAAEPIIVVFTSDETYAGPLSVALLSLLENAAADTVLRVFILDAGLSEAAKKGLDEVAARFGQALEYIRTDPASTASLQPHAHISTATYLRLFIPRLLPASLSRAIYLDCDILVQADLTPLWRTELADFPLAAVEDYGVNLTPSLTYLKVQLDMYVSETYFNSGVLLFNLDYWRRDQVGETVLQYALNHPERLRFCDQDALNSVLRGRWAPLPLRWNQQSFVFTHPAEAVPPEKRPAWLQALEDPAIIHFAAPSKPWLEGCAHPARQEYRLLMARTAALWTAQESSQPHFSSRTGRRKIISISMVKNEEDVIESFVRYHCRFLDGMVILDNRSQDNTRVILMRLQQEGLPLVLLNDIHPGFDQGIKTTALAQQVLAEEKPDLILLLDGDEFVTAADDRCDPRELLEALPTGTLHYVKWRTYVPSPGDDPGELFVPRRMGHIREESVEIDWKVILPGVLAGCTGWSVGNGNHWLWFSDSHSQRLPERKTEELRLAHFPIRSANQYLSKTVSGWLNQLADGKRLPGESIQWQRGFEMLKSGVPCDPQALLAAAKEYSSCRPADSVETVSHPMQELYLRGLQLRYSSLAATPWMSRVLSVCESIALDHARLQRERGDLQTSLNTLQQSYALLQQECRDWRNGCHELQRARHELQGAVDDLRQSRSWRLTAPLRAAGQLLRALRSR